MFKVIYDGSIINKNICILNNISVFKDYKYNFLNGLNCAVYVSTNINSTKRPFCHILKLALRKNIVI